MMISRILIAALCCAYAAALSPIAPPNVLGDSSECALYLNGPARSTAYDYSINLLKGNFGYEGQSNCITYEAINQAYLEARNRILVTLPKGDWKAEHFASVGELILDISINLARRYGLTYEEIEKGLPLIDTSRTLIREVCPPVFSHVECRAGKYRRFDGLCNNLQNPTWGATMAPFQRLIGPLFADGINSPRIAHHGKDLPLSRVVSRTMHPDEGFHDHAGTVMVIAWGQFMDHDYTLTATPLDPVNRNDPEECCKRPPHLKHPYCNEIRIPDDDYFYRLFGVKCIDFVRGFPSPRPGCRLGSRVPFNTLTGTIDGNTVYGVTEKFARKLRTGFGGLLRMNPVFKEYGLKDLLPLKLDIPDEGCTRPNKNMYCFEAGEIRVNEQLVLTVMHTLMAREHNRIANGLAEVNPHWDDETLFQEARRINIAEIQHITYNEFLPILLGKDVMEKFGLVVEKEGYWDGYDPEVNPDVIASFASAAYRFGHSLLPTAVERWSTAHKFIASKRLSDLIRRPYDLYRAGVLDEYVMGLMNQVAQAMDDSITQEVTNHLFKKVGARFGMDLVSFNMQRGREFGIPGYMEFRKFCGLPPADTFQDLFGSMPNATVQKYETIFDHPIDVDLWSGGVSERPLPGSMLGPTFACIIATQFSYSRRGDRFWYELPNQPSSFTPEQLKEIRKARMARIICDNTDIIDTVQLYPMVLPDHELNPRVPCRSGIIPMMDFSKWAEPAPSPFHGAAKQFIIWRNDYTAIAKPDIGKNDNKLIQIDDVEVKPVVEINPENDNDSSEENKKPNVSEEVESLESILGVKEPENDDSQNDKIIDQKVVQDGDVKQEFERIPLNYNHAEKNENKEHQAPESPKEDPELQQKEGTLDAFAPEDIKYDEHLNIKFDDLAIKLPEIKLPDDILAYSRQDSPYSDDDYKKRLQKATTTQADVPSYKPSYYFNQNDKEETHERKDEREHRNSNDDSDNDDDHAPDTGYYGYYDNSKKKQNYKNKNADEEEEEESEDNEDLYEKFVRERFGKQGTFQKRSEKLQQAAPLNPDLYKTIKQILKKTADIDEQAKKSGDPNAGYMWTLEYGEKL
ncbi:unnamed protein product [Spodoptera exigua]|nr:unnamed protein product [Spodoptera exigua]